MTNSELEDRMTALSLPPIKLVRKDSDDEEYCYISRVDANASSLIKVQIDSNIEVNNTHHDRRRVRVQWMGTLAF